MTIQVNDPFWFQGEAYYLVAYWGASFLNPSSFDIDLAGFSDDCRRGFIATYEVTDQALFLTGLEVEASRGKPQAIQEVMPRTQTLRQNQVLLPYRKLYYRGLKVIVPFTGFVRLGKRINCFLSQKISCSIAFEVLYEFIFESGLIVYIQDLSSENARDRAEFMATHDWSILHQEQRNGWHLAHGIAGSA